MKTFNEFNNTNTNNNPLDRSYDQDNGPIVEGINLRTISAVALVSKSSNLNKNIKSIKIDDSELDKKLNLLSKQLLFNSILTAQLGVMSKKR